MSELYNVYCDYDGVLVDFIAGMVQIYGKEVYPPYVPDSEWRASKEFKMLCDGTTIDWWASLPPMHDYHELWTFLKPYRPHILTAYSEWTDEGAQRSIEGKRLWNEKWTKVSDWKLHIVHKNTKAMFAKTWLSYDIKPNVLIDDNRDNIESWRAEGGIAILHESAKITIGILKELGYGN